MPNTYFMIFNMIKHISYHIFYITCYISLKLICIDIQIWDVLS